MDIKESIYVAGAREKNLKNIDIKIPKKKINRVYWGFWFR